jgi:hypothetical protein
MSYYLTGSSGSLTLGLPLDGTTGQLLAKASDTDFDLRWVDPPAGTGGAGSGTVTSVGLAAPTGFSVSGSPITGSGTLTMTYAAGYSLPLTASQTNWDTAFSERLRWDGGAAGLVAATGRTSLELKGAAVLDVGTTAGTVAAGNDSRFSTNLSYTIATRVLASSTGTSATLPLFSSADAGLVAGSGGGTTNFLRADGTWAAPPGGGGSGTVTSVGLSLPNLFSVSGSPVTASGTLTASLTTQSANLVWAGPTTGAAVAPTFRALVAGDIPTIASSQVSGLGTAAAAATTDFLPTTFSASAISYAASVTLDMSALAGGYRTIALTGDLTLATSNRASGRQVTLRLTCDATQRTLNFPAGWTFIGSKPSTIAALSTVVLSITFFGTAETDCVAACSGSPFTQTGTGSLVFSASPTLTAPALGTPSALVLTNATGLPLATGTTGLLPVANGGTGTATPGLVAGTNVTVSGTWPNQTINASGSGGGGSGTVTSVGLSLPGLFSVSGSPVTSSGTLTASLATQSANLVWAGPTTGVAAAPTFRQLGYSELSGLPTLGTAAAAASTAFAASGAITGSGLTVTSSRVIGRSAAGTGAPEEFALLGLAFNGTNLATLADLVIPLADETSTITASTRLTIPYWPRPTVLTDVPIWAVATQPGGTQPMQFDIRVGGTTIFTATLPTIATGVTNSTASGSVAGTFSTAFTSAGSSIAAGAVVAFLLTQQSNGSAGAGAGLKVALFTRRAG